MSSKLRARAQVELGNEYQDATHGNMFPQLSDGFYAGALVSELGHGIRGNDEIVVVPLALVQISPTHHREFFRQHVSDMNQRGVQRGVKWRVMLRVGSKK